MGLLKKRINHENITGMPQMHEVTLTKIFPHADLVPIEFKHTQKFYDDGANPLEYERERLKGLPTDWLMKDKRIPAIKADSQREIELAKLQRINHTYTIQTIIDLERGDIAHSEEMISRISTEIKRYEAEEERLRALMKRRQGE